MNEFENNNNENGFENTENISEAVTINNQPEFSKEEAPAEEEKPFEFVTQSQYPFYSENIYKAPERKNTWIGVIAGAVAGILLTVAVGAVALYKTGVIKKPEISEIISGDRNQENSFEFNRLADGEREPKSVVDIAAEVGPSVVMVTTTATVSTIFGNSLQQGSGSGIIISDDGYIVTNEHVVSGATELSVITNTGEEYSAKLIGADNKSDLAVIKIEATGLIPATLGNSEELEVGELVVAIGNPLGQELFGTVTDGIVSAVNRSMTVENRTYNLIQTNAAINPGNSGGALVDRFGNVIGINTIKLSNTEVEGIGFAIAITEAKPIIADLMNNGYVSGRPLVGITVTENRNGLSVYSIAQGSGAELAGIEIGDLIVKADGNVINTSQKLNEIRDTKKPGEKITLTVIRNGELKDIEVVLGEDVPTE